MRASTLAALSLALLPASAQASGVVGTGSAASCTEAALNTALTGGGSVTFNCGGGPVTIPITATKTIAATTSLDGAGQQITLDAQGATRHFLTQYSNTTAFSLTLRNLTLRNGHAADYGGAIRLVFQEPARLLTLTIDHVTFANNVCDAAGNDVGGGAIYALGGFVNITNSVFTGNRGGNGGALGQIQARFTIADSVFSANTTNPRAADGGNGGAIYIDGSNLGTLTIERSVFTGNTATNLGGAIHTYMYGGASAMVVQDATFADNVGSTNGGAIFHMNGGLTIMGSTFSGNRVVGQGGALWVTDGGGGTNVAVTNSTFTGNQATGTRPNNGSVGLGGAITNSGASSLALTNVTIAGNHADWVGGGIVSGTAGTTLKNSIVANNTAANGGNPWNIGKNCSNPLGNGGGNLQWPTLNPNDGNDHPCANGIAFADPRLAPLAANGGPTQTMALLSGSPALNGGVACPPPSTDQRGVTRPQGAACDSGALESRPQADLSIAKTDNGASPLLPGQAITYTIVARNGGPTAATGATVADTFPASLTGVTWTCAASTGSSCTASGAGSLNQLANLAVGGTATYTVHATVVASAIRLVANTATITVPATSEDPNQANNSATVVTLLERPQAFHTVSPCRVVDTRNAAGPVGGPSLSAGASRSFLVVGRCGIPATAWAVSLNVTTTNATAAGNIRVYPGGTPVAPSSTLNYAPGQTRANNTAVLLGPTGEVAAFCGQATGISDFILDVNGYFE
jgi:uncharacterized repeat protein (TIGR01451 family)